MMYIFAIIGILVVTVCLGVISGLAIDKPIDYIVNREIRKEEKRLAERKAYEDEARRKVEMRYGMY